MKLILKLLVVLIVLVVVAVAVGIFFVDRIAKSAVEESGTKALGVETTLDWADVGIRKGRFAMQGLRVDNPDGFASDYFLLLDKGDVNVDFKTLLDDTVELPELNLSGVEVNLDRKGLENNYDVIFENLKKYESTGEGEGKQFVIRQVSVDDVFVHVDTLPIGGPATRLDLKIDNVTVHDIGSGADSGKALAEVWDVLLKAIFAAIIEKGGGIIPDDVLSGLSDGLAGLGSLGDDGIKFSSGAVEQIGAIGADVVEGAGEAVKEIGEGIGNLLGGEKKDGEEKEE